MKLTPFVMLTFLGMVGTAVAAPVVAAPASTAVPDALAWDAPHVGNPIAPGYYADPSLVQHEGKFYLYATLDPWGGDTLGCWESTDFRNWTYRVLNWPTKLACTSPTSKGAMVWAPSVVRAPTGKFHMFVSVGSEVWAGVADHPLGPWKNALGDKPLVAADWNKTYHMIDAEAFIDDDGSAYLYWGSGWNWTNGHCFAVKLKPDLATFDGEPKDVTPGNYFEGPFMVKHGGKYFLTYSQGKTTTDTYQVHYAVGDSPLGPFAEAGNSPILVTDHARKILSPGHHAVFSHAGKSFILYHRHRIPFDPKSILRQLCVDPLEFMPDGLIAKVTPTHVGVAVIPRAASSSTNLATLSITRATASSVANDTTGAERVLDDNYATRWAAAKDAKGGWLQLDLGAPKRVARHELEMEFAWKPQHFLIETSLDGVAWQRVYRADTETGSPLRISTGDAGEARYLRLVFPETLAGADIAVFEWRVFAD